MDPQRFDSLVRTLGAAATRRGALAAFLTGLAAPLLPGLTADARRGKGKGKGKTRDRHQNRDHGKAKRHGRDQKDHKDHGDNQQPAKADVTSQGHAARSHGKGKGKGKRRGKERAQAQAMAASCCGTRSCPLPPAGANVAQCNFAGKDLSGRDLTLVNFGNITGTGADFSGAIARGANFGAACLSEAKFTGADLRDTQFGAACLFAANLRDAQIDVARVLRPGTALLCNTTMPDGTVNNRDCGKASPCCPQCTGERPCPEGQRCCDGKCLVAECCQASDCPEQTCRTKACTNNACVYSQASNGTSCNDGNPCTVDDVCRNGECVGAAKDCTGKNDACNDGVCRAEDGECVKQPKADGIACSDNDNCTVGDSCQGGECTPGAGINCNHLNDDCNTGRCDASDGQCVKDPQADGTACGRGGQCQAGQCVGACLELAQVCTPSNNTCCDDATCEVLATGCYATNAPKDPRCCNETHGTCSHECECCGNSFCEGGACCRHTGSTCTTAAECCQAAFNRQACVSGKCCALDDEPCEGENDCCAGLCSPEGRCTGCLSLQQECADNEQCCQSGGLAVCEPSCDFNNATCCHPPGGTCSSNCDCCGGETCCNGRCCSVDQSCVNGSCQGNCRQLGEICNSSGLCCADLECRDGLCRPAICFEFDEFCGDGSIRPCCQGECGKILFGGFGRYCCNPEGGECHDFGRFFPGGDCCGANVCNLSNQCAPCRTLGQTCDGIAASSNCCNQAFNIQLLCDGKHTQRCVKCPKTGDPCFDGPNGLECCDIRSFCSNGVCT